MLTSGGKRILKSGLEKKEWIRVQQWVGKQWIVILVVLFLLFNLWIMMYVGPLHSIALTLLCWFTYRLGRDHA
jgi:hypothetical protein